MMTDLAPLGPIEIYLDFISIFFPAIALWACIKTHGTVPPVPSAYCQHPRAASPDTESSANLT
jgi:hypothetical protein